MLRWDETWHRLLEWTSGQAKAERLAAQVLDAEEEYSALDPSHPLGGRDRGKDALVLRNGVRWVMAVYFPRGKKTFGAIRTKFIADFDGVVANAAQGMAFVTNQELTLAQRQQLREAVDGPVDLFHLERVTHILDRPSMHAVREQFLDIPAVRLAGDEPSTDELERDLREALRLEYSFLSTRGLPHDLREGEPRLPMDEVYVPLRVRVPAEAEIGEALDRLSYRERRVLELRFGLGDFRRTLVEVGRTFNVSSERIRQIEASDLSRIRTELLGSPTMARLGLDLDWRATSELILGRHRGVPVTEALGGRRLVVLGGPGSGKSTLTRWLTWAMASGRRELLSHVPEGGLPFQDLGRRVGRPAAHQHV
jgi:hypothetical protein